MIPKYIDKKVDKLNTLLEQAYTLKAEIEDWVQKKGGDINAEWYRDVVDECSAVNGIYKEGLYEYIKNISQN